ncbi:MULTISPECIES: hypothetical protein [unclassified Sphingomonas]|uniref:hypothetical protein n=1 Tax=unclassified Sphingomonas TaxID=196159 RepID=UPI002151A8F9|nr:MULTISPECIES: hypothetical protein [unclassified Sphingomonas]MCR5870675.1 hypothetical protein [Sphingomonas sp. J344]UUY00989.1 hypothetical protein LRS08_08015 [Sphingomonas sp. J315]
MSLTKAELDELRRLERELRDEDDKEQGGKHLDKAAAARPTRPPKPRPFSIYRVTVGGLRDAAQGLIDTVGDLAGYTARRDVQLGQFSQNPLTGLPGGGVVGSALDLVKRTRPGGAIAGAVSSTFAPGSAGRKATTLPTLEGEENAGVAERVLRGLTSYAIPFTGYAKAVGIARGATWLGRAGRGMLAGAAVDFTQSDPVSGNIANALRDGFGLKSDVLDALAAEDDDDALETRFRAAAVGAPIGLLGDAAFEVGSKAIRAYRAWKGTADEAAATVAALKKDVKLDPKARNLPTVANDNVSRGANDNAAGAADAEFSDIPKGAYDPSKDAKAAPNVTDFEDVLDYLKRKSGDLEVDEATAARFAENLLFGDPENALAKIGIDPAKLDFSKFDDPDMLGRLQKGMAELYETYASKLGRSNLRITEAATASAARSLASTADVLKSVHGSTSNLAEELMGARMFVGAHAHKLLALADEAATEIVSGGAGAKWAEFLEAFHRHAYYLGALRGAGSEVGRALRSLQTLAKVSKPKAAKTVTDALETEAVSTGRAVSENRVVQGASEFAERLVTDAEKLEALARLTSLGGDVGELSRHVRRENMSVLRRLDGALKETVGNLFSSATAIYNVASGATMLGSRILERTMSMMARLALAPLGGKAAGAQARLAVMDAWAYSHGLVSSFGEAFANTIRVLEKEGGSELSLNLDTLGLHKLAMKAADRSNRAAGEIIDGSFERADVKSYRNLAILPSEWRAMQQMAREMPGPEFLQEGLAAFARVIAGSTNVVGSLSRLGTILFINLPDQFIGTLAARAGAYSHAVRTAASEAAELGLEGPSLSQYLKARTIQLADHSAGWSDDGFEAGVREAVGAAGEAEAREVLFQDELELIITQKMNDGLGATPLLHLVVPFIKTPLRILERTAIDYTPWASSRTASGRPSWPAGQNGMRRSRASRWA